MIENKKPHIAVRFLFKYKLLVPYFLDYSQPKNLIVQGICDFGTFGSTALRLIVQGLRATNYF